MPARLRRTISFLLGLLALAAPEIARACSVCGAGREDETRVAFLLTTLFLSVLPLAMLGGLLAWVRWRLRRRTVDEREPIAPPAAAPHA
jgi:hypothetical protein